MEWLTSIRTAGAGCPATPKVSEGTVPRRYGLVCRVECPQALIKKVPAGAVPSGTSAFWQPAPSAPAPISPQRHLTPSRSDTYSQLLTNNY